MQDIPIIDCGSLDRAATREALDRACREWGFFHLTRRTIDRQLYRPISWGAFRAARAAGDYADKTVNRRMAPITRLRRKAVLKDAR